MRSIFCVLLVLCACLPSIAGGDSHKLEITPQIGKVSSILLGQRIGSLRIEFEQVNITNGEDGDPKPEITTVISAVRFRDVHTNAVYELDWLHWGDRPIGSELIEHTDICSPGGSWVAIPLPHTEGIYFENSNTFVSSVESNRPKGFVFKVVGDKSNINTLFFHYFLRWKNDNQALIKLSFGGTDHDIIVNLKTKQVGGHIFNSTMPRFEKLEKLFVKTEVQM